MGHTARKRHKSLDTQIERPKFKWIPELSKLSQQTRDRAKPDLHKTKVSKCSELSSPSENEHQAYRELDCLQIWSMFSSWLFLFWTSTLFWSKRKSRRRTMAGAPASFSIPWWKSLIFYWQHNKLKRKMDKSIQASPYLFFFHPLKNTRT